MWYLISENDKRAIYVLPEKNVHIGRYFDAQSCNFAITEDASISRKHAELLIINKDLFLKDLGSKYGTFVNGLDKLEINAMTKLNNNDIVKFGKLNSIWKVQQNNFVTCTSTLKGENLQILKNCLGALGGTLKNEWDDTCAYLTMPAITLTIKVVLALVQNSQIVNIDYWKTCLESISSNERLPDPNKFIPQISESTLNSDNVTFSPNVERCALFTGKKVIFFSEKQLQMYKTVLKKSSAIPLLFNDSKLTKVDLCEDNVIVIQCNSPILSHETQAQKDLVGHIIEHLKSNGRRVIADAEIGLAILYCSTSKYCNPKFSLPAEVVKQVPKPVENSKNILAQESQEPSLVLPKKENVLIDESLTQKHFSMENTASSKRKLSDDDISGTNKKMATGSTNATLNSTGNKRQGEFSDCENPTKRIAMTNEDDNDMFNFMKSAPSSSNQNSKKLNLTKATKRKLSADVEDDLFNFVDNNKKVAIEKPSNLLESQDTDDFIDTKINCSQNYGAKVDLNALRGSKLVELMKNNLNIECKNIKKEDTSDMDEKSNIDFGSTTVVVRNDLIVKQEPIEIQVHEGGVKNFKKFKKVWPTKMEVKLVPKLINARNIAEATSNNISV